MNKPNYFRSLKIALSFLLLVTVIFSCETEGLEQDFTSQNNSMLRAYESCSSACLEADSDDYFVKSETQTGSAGPNAKAVSYFAYNTQSEFVVEVSYDITSGKSKSKADIAITINEVLMEFEDVESGSTVRHSIALANDWEACDLMTFNVYQTGLSNPINFTSSYNLIGICPDDCEETFYYEQNEDESYTFTYMSEEDLEDAEIKFTAPHITDFNSLDSKVYQVNPGNGKGSPTVLSWMGDIEACKEITFTLSFSADCEQNAAGFANVFTDFKVNDISKKGDNSNIRIECEN